jgi:NADP-dependent 3-hydroxy acid dehydrogenase YdfG
MKNNPLAIVTGGSSGIGKAITYALFNDNYSVINADVASPEEIVDSPINHIPCDITDPADVEKLSLAVQKLKAPDVLVLNAGQGIHEKLSEGDPEKWAQIINLNIMGTLRVLRAILPLMHEGNVIFISSVSSKHPHPYGGIYSATKSAIETIAETLRLEEQHRINVTVISPGIVDTPFFENMISGTHTITDIGWGAVTPQEVADAVCFILKQKKQTSVHNLTICPTQQKL